MVSRVLWREVWFQPQAALRAFLGPAPRCHSSPLLRRPDGWHQRFGALRPVVAVAVVALAGGCGAVCDDANTICGFEALDASTDCADVSECAALCIVDQDACDVNNAEAPESKCIAQCLAQPEAT